MLEAEDPDEFRARIQALVDQYEGQITSTGARRGPIEADADLETWEPLSQIPVLCDDIKEVRPPPDLDAGTQRDYDRMQWILYLLRR